MKGRSALPYPILSDEPARCSLPHCQSYRLPRTPAAVLPSQPLAGLASVRFQAAPPRLAIVA